MMEVSPTSISVHQGFVDAMSFRGLVFVSGQVATNADGEVVGTDASQQSKVAFDNLFDVLERSGSNPSRILKLGLFVTDSGHIDPVRAERNRRFVGLEHYPASTILVVAGLAHPRMLVEVEAVAALNPGGGP